MRVESFPPLVGPRCRVLVLGSMPGTASLTARGYYAHPRNAFWPIMAALTGVDAKAPYAQRTAQLVAAGVAVWDVCAVCVRPGSLDADIEPGSVVANDIPGLLRDHPAIQLVALNGGAAARMFRRLVEPALPRAVAVVALPSSSPAHAARSLADKEALWRAALAPVLGRRRGRL
jgi:double-stranded uracil-DNA glycosylase